MKLEEPNYHFDIPSLGKSYELIDSGGFEKLERFGEFILARPEPQAVWDKSLEESVWLKKAHAIFKKTKGRDQLNPDERGEWQNQKKMPEKWFMDYVQDGFNFKFKLSLSSFKHVGIFPEQSANWQYLANQIQAYNAQKPTEPFRLLNLFAYTGGASIVAKANGADVTHVDAIKQVISWSRESMEASTLKDIRWVIEDALKFVKREVKRGKKYNGIILDPPAYGRGPDGEKWILEEGINDLIKSTLELLDPKHFYLLNLYSMGFSAVIAETIIKQNKPDLQNPQMGELILQDSFQKRLPLGVFYRFSSI